MKIDLIADILAARGPAIVRIANVLDYSNDLSLVLSKFGLVQDEALLVAQDRAGAIAILTNLLWKEQAYNYERMDRNKAEELAEKIISEMNQKVADIFLTRNHRYRIHGVVLRARHLTRVLS